MKILSLVLAAALAACAPLPATAPPPADSSPAGVHFSAEKVSPGVVRLMLDNGAPHRIGYNLCTSVLQRRSGSEWAQQPSTDVCTMQLLTLNPGADATFEKRPGSVPAGEYRYVTRIESPLNTPPVTIGTAPFTLP
jgi:hypothetical protein